MALIGGFIAGKKEIVKYFRYNLRSQIYAKSVPMAIVKGALKRLDIIRTEKQHLENLCKIVHALQNGFRERGFNIGQTNSPVTPVMLNGTVGEATSIVHDLRENYKIFCSIVIYPVIPKGMILLRIIPTASHSLADVEETIQAFTEVREKLKNGTYGETRIVSMGESH